MISTSPDGRGLSAEVTLPQGSVNNSGQLIADGGTIAMRAQVVNQGGLVQANSVRQVNGVIELYASDSLSLGANSTISAQGDTQGVSSGGSITIKSDNTFSDQKGSVINISGGAQGGNGGNVDISAPQMSAIHSTINGHAANGYTAGSLLIDPDNIFLEDYGASAPANGAVNAGDPPTPGTLTLDVNTFNDLINNGQLSQISLAANQNIEVGTLWSVPDSTVAGSSINLTAGRNITIDDGAGIQAGRNWTLNLKAGTELTSANNRQSGQDGIYLWGSGILQTINGDINLTAGNEVMIDDGSTGNSVFGNGITTTGGGNINVTATFGDVDTGANPSGYLFGQHAAPYYRVSPNLGGISTAAGGNVSITAGGNVTSYLPLNNDNTEAGSGAYGPEAGNVNITAGGSVFGHYVVANGTGTITALNGNVGAPLTSQGFALSLASGSWNVSAPHGSIYLQEVRNPNGVFNTHGSPGSYAGYHLFDYSANASLTLDAPNGSVEITGLGIPRTGDPVPILLPPSLTVNAGAGGFVLDTSVILFPSAQGNLNITTTDGGNLVGTPDFAGNYPTLSMSGSSKRQWTSSTDFTPADEAAMPIELNNANPVNISIAGSIDTLNLFTTKATQITVGGDIINSSFIGENLHPSDITSISVGGQIYNQPYYSFVTLTQPIVPANIFNPTWDSIFGLLVNPSLIASTTVPNNLTTADLKAEAALMALFQVSPGASPNPGFVYDPSTLRLGFGGVMSSATLAAMTGPLEAITLDPSGLPEVANGHFVTHTVSFVPASDIVKLYTASQVVPKTPLAGFQIGGPGQFNISAGSMELGSSEGIESWGYGGTYYGNLLPYTQSGAAVNVTLSGNLDMVTSRIASFDGGNVSVASTGGEMDLGSQDLFGTSALAFGIYTSGHSDVSVIADKDVNINGSRIASYNGGNIFVESLAGNVNAGSGGNASVNVPLVSAVPGPHGLIADTSEDPIYGSGIVALSLPKSLQTPGGNPLPGNITIDTPRGNIVSEEAGILQLALDGSITGGPTVTLNAGTPASGGNPAIPGNIDLGNSGLIGGTVNLSAQGNITGLVISRQDSTINAAQNFSGVSLSGGTSHLDAGGSISGTVIGIGGISASGGSGISASLLSQSVSAGGKAAVSTLGTSATATSAGQSAAQQSTADAKQQLASTDTLGQNLDKKKKKGPVLQRVKRVTVILPKA